MPDRSLLLEIPVFSAGDALAAATYGAGRLELCSSYLEGGLTPGPGLLAYVKKRVAIPVFVMIRPKAGNFFYSPEDISVMEEEIRQFKTLGADGFVFGILNEHGELDKSACRQLVQLAGGLPCTFHRAFDAITNKTKALQDAIECGFARILTSGHPNNVSSGLPVLADLLRQAGDDIIIMPGGGLKPEHLNTLNKEGRLKDIHASCRNKKAGETAQIDQEIVHKFKVNGMI